MTCLTGDMHTEFKYKSTLRWMSDVFRQWFFGRCEGGYSLEFSGFLKQNEIFENRLDHGDLKKENRKKKVAENRVRVELRRSAGRTVARTGCVQR